MRGKQNGNSKITWNWTGKKTKKEINACIDAEEKRKKRKWMKLLEQKQWIMYWTSIWAHYTSNTSPPVRILWFNMNIWKASTKHYVCQWVKFMLFLDDSSSSYGVRSSICEIESNRIFNFVSLKIITNKLKLRKQIESVCLFFTKALKSNKHLHFQRIDSPIGIGAIQIQWQKCHKLLKTAEQKKKNFECSCMIHYLNKVLSHVYVSVQRSSNK